MVENRFVILELLDCVVAVTLLSIWTEKANVF